MNLGISGGMFKRDLLAAVARGLDFGALRANLTEQPGVLEVADAATLRVQLTTTRFEIETEGITLEVQQIGGGNYAQIITQWGNSVRQSVTVLDINPEEMVCIGCLLVAYETTNPGDWGSATFYLYVTDIELISL